MDGRLFILTFCGMVLMGIYIASSNNKKWNYCETNSSVNHNENNFQLRATNVTSTQDDYSQLNYFDTPDFTDINGTIQYYSYEAEDKSFITTFLKKPDGKPFLNGFFVEMGAIDGKIFSNTKMIENNYGWRGILIEANPTYCNDLLKSDRKRSIKLCMAVCPEVSLNFSEYVFNNPGGHGKSEYMDGVNHMHKKATYTYPCHKLKHIFENFNVKKIDLFSLDVERSESDVIETFDFKIPVKYWIIESYEIVEIDRINVKKFREKLQSHGYVKCSFKINGPNDCWTLPNYDQL